MTDEQDETPLDQRLKALAQDYNAPPALDREAMWRAIEARQLAAGDRQQAVAGRPQAVSGRRRARGSRRPIMSSRAAAWISGIAALLIIGIGIGRITAPEPARVASVDAPVTAKAPSTALEIAAAQHLSQSEAYLTLFRASVRSNDVDSLPVAAARQLLATNRLLLDSPVADARLRPLLLDLELVLAEITQLGNTKRPDDVKLITDGLDQGDVMMRLRVAPGRRSLPNGVL
jgi:hypothetical protein